MAKTIGRLTALRNTIVSSLRHAAERLRQASVGKSRRQSGYLVSPWQARQEAAQAENGPRDRQADRRKQARGLTNA